MSIFTRPPAQRAARFAAYLPTYGRLYAAALVARDIFFYSTK